MGGAVYNEIMPSKLTFFFYRVWARRNLMIIKVFTLRIGVYLSQIDKNLNECWVFRQQSYYVVQVLTAQYRHKP